MTLSLPEVLVRAVEGTGLRQRRRTSRSAVKGEPLDGAEAQVAAQPPAPRAGWDRLVAYGFPSLVVLLATTRWFSAGAFMASGDVPPYIRTNLAHEVFSLWNHQASGGGSTYYAILQLPDVVLLQATAAMRLSAPMAQHLLVDAVLLTTAVGSAHLSRVWLRSPWAAAFAGLVGVFTYFTLITLPNLLPALAIGLVGLLVGRVLRAAAGRRIRATGTAAMVLPVGYLAQNPPLVVVTAVALLAAAAAAPLLIAAPNRSGSARRAWGHLLRTAPWAALISLWWMTPFVQTLLDGHGLTFAAQTDVNAWAWTQVRATIANILWLNTGWGWAQPAYFPYGAKADAGLSGAAHWVLPALALIGLVLADRGRRRTLWTLAALTAVLVFFSKGSHAPAGAVNLWLYAHVPGLWLLRDPMAKLGVLLVLVYAVSAGLALERGAALVAVGTRRLHARSDRAGPRLGRGLHLAGVSALVALAAVAVGAPWPLWTGAVAPASNPLLAPARVKVPPAWYSLAARVNAVPGDGKTLVLPLDPFYQVSTSWGYHGTDAVPAQLLKNPVLAELPGGYYGLPTALQNLLDGVQEAAVAGDTGQLPGLLHALGVSTVLVRSDLLDTPETPTSADPRRIAAAFKKTLGVREEARTAVGTAFRVMGGQSPVSEASALVGVRAEDATALVGAVGELAPGSVATAGMQGLSSLVWEGASGHASQRFTLAPGRTYRVRLASPTGNLRVVEAFPGGPPVLHLLDADSVTVDGRRVPSQLSASVPMSTRAVVGVSIGDSFAAAAGPAAVVAAGAGDVVTAFAVVPGTRSVLGPFGAPGDCDSGGPVPSGEARAPGTSATHGFTLTAIRHTTCVAAALPATGITAATYQVSLDYRSMGGPTAQLCVYRNERTGCGDLPALADSRERWVHYTGLIRLPGGLAAPRLYLYAEAAGAGSIRTAVSYRRVAVRRLFAAGSAQVTTSPPTQQYLLLAAGEHRAVASSMLPAVPALAFGSLSDCNAAEPADAGLSLGRTGDGTLTLGAASDSACVSSDAAPVSGAGRLRLRLQYRTVAGLPARVCVWEIGPDRCAGAPALVTADDWMTLDTEVSTDPGTSAVQVYLYADGQPAPRTSVQYRDVVLSPATARLVVITPAGDSADSVPLVSTTHQSAGSYRSSVTGADGQFILVLADSYAPGWTLSRLPAGWTAKHFLANGYANGWVVHGTGSAQLQIAYTPNGLAAAGQALSVSSLVVLALAGAGQRFWARRKRRRRTPSTTLTAAAGSA